MLCTNRIFNIAIGSSSKPFIKRVMSVRRRISHYCLSFHFLGFATYKLKSQFCNCFYARCSNCKQHYVRVFVCINYLNFFQGEELYLIENRKKNKIRKHYGILMFRLIKKLVWNNISDNFRKLFK